MLVIILTSYDESNITPGIYQYNLNTNNIKLIKKYPLEIIDKNQTFYHDQFLDLNHKLLYIYDGNPFNKNNTIIFNLTTKQFNIYDKFNVIHRRFTRSIESKNKIYIIDDPKTYFEIDLNDLKDNDLNINLQNNVHTKCGDFCLKSHLIMVKQK